MNHNNKTNKDQDYSGEGEALIWVQNLRGTKKTPNTQDK